LSICKKKQIEITIGDKKFIKHEINVVDDIYNYIMDLTKAADILDKGGE